MLPLGREVQAERPGSYTAFRDRSKTWLERVQTGVAAV